MTRGVSTCVASLANPGQCCAPGCDLPPVVAILLRIVDDEPGKLMECARCLNHIAGAVLASKPMPQVSPEWKGTIDD